VLHEDELPVDVDLVRRLIAAQFPEWADLSVEPFDSGGTSNWIFLLGDAMYVRMRRRPSEPSKVLGEQDWLALLALELPVAIPRVLGRGEPGEGFPLPWTILDWVPGDPATPDQLRDPASLAVDVAEFVRAMRAIDPTDGPPPNEDNNWRACPLALRDDSMRRRLAECEGLLDVAAATAAWDRALAAPTWDGPPTFVHGDLISGNVLVADGRLTGVIDFGCLAVGDPATDLMAAWGLFGPHARGVFRESLEIDDPMWLRGAGWALSVGVIALPYYLHTSPVMTRSNWHLIDQVLADGMI
jgi:aminoglycoside phosphotransferase (APT) family kinase protein